MPEQRHMPERRNGLVMEELFCHLLETVTFDVEEHCRVYVCSWLEMTITILKQSSCDHC